MSSIPKAKRSNITDLVVIPDNWDSYPNIEYSHVKNCKFEGLNVDTRIERSQLENVDITSDGTAATRVERSLIKDSELRHTTIERSEIQGTQIDSARIERSRLTLANIIGPKVRIERSVFDKVDVKGDSKIARCNMNEVLVEDSKVESGNYKSSLITSSKIERSNLADCDVADCKIQRTNFSGMYLRNGVWERGDLVGRVDKTKEVIIKPIAEMRDTPPGRREPEDLLTGPSREAAPEYGYPADLKLPLQPTTAPTMSVNEKEQEWSDAGMATPPSPSHSTATGILDEEIARPYIRDDYDGPDIDSLPPYDEINPEARR